jgi:DNA-binding NarL/FixJ family response regulator
MDRIVIVDDHPVVRAGVRSLLRRDPDMQIVGEFAAAEDAIRVLPALRPDVVILDHCLQGMSGAVAVREIRALQLGTRILMLTSRMSDNVLRSCLSAGADGYLLKDAPREELLRSVRAIARGEAVIASELLTTLVQMSNGRPRGSAPTLDPIGLSALSLVSQGAKVAEIARKLQIGQTNVKQRLRDVTMKLGARDRCEAVAVALREGMI